jgi:hypothetical protein
MSARIITGRAVMRKAIVPSVLLTLTAGLGLLASAPDAALAGTPAVITPAGPGPIVSGYNKTKCITDEGDSVRNDTPIVISDCTGGPEQQWTVEADGTVQVNGKCMDVYRERKYNRAMVILYTCHGSSNQQWEAVGGTLVNPVSRKCLDDPAYKTTNGTQLQLYTCNGGRNQQWVLPAASPDISLGRG